MVSDNLSMENMTIKTIMYSTNHTGIWVTVLTNSTKVNIRNNRFIGRFYKSLSTQLVTGTISGNFFFNTEIGIEVSDNPSIEPPIIVFDNLVYRCAISIIGAYGVFINNLVLDFSNAGLFIPIFGGSGRFFNNLVIGKKGYPVDGLDYARGTFRNNVIRNCTTAVSLEFRPLDLVNTLILYKISTLFKVGL